MENRLYLASPHMGGEEMKYIQEAFDLNWIAPLGKNVDEFEKEIANYVGVGYAAALSSGTSAIHLALKWLGIKEGDKVICSSLTFSGSCNSILYEKAIPVFIDCEPETYNMSPIALKRALEKAKNENNMPKAAIIVDLYGAPADYDKLLPILKEYNIPVIEDAAESLGATYHGRKVGSFGDLSILSFNGNKIITTSGGGILLCNDENAIKKARFWATQSRDPAPYYQHSEIGYNYRMSNICAGIGRGQLKVLDLRVRQKREIHTRYLNAFKNSCKFSIINSTCGEPSCWLSIGLLKNENTDGIDYMKIYDELNKNNIESRPLWKPMHLQPIFSDYEFYSHHESGESISENAFKRGICLPSDTKMTEEQQNEVIKIIKKVLNED